METTFNGIQKHRNVICFVVALIMTMVWVALEGLSQPSFPSLASYIRLCLAPKLSMYFVHKPRAS
jgi:hypothetical protein